MEFKREEFSKEFISKFKDDEFDIVLDFCKCYHEKFGKYINKDMIITKIQEIDTIKHYYDEKSKAMASHYVSWTDNATKIFEIELGINDAKWQNATIEDKKAIMYHELIHHFSTKEIKGRKIQRGLGICDAKETSYLDEVMTEYYAAELLKIDNIDLKEKIISYKSNDLKLSREEEYITTQGAGYQPIAGLGQIYDRILGKRIFDGQTNDYIEFEKQFNERYKELGREPLEIIQNELKEGINSSSRQSIYKCYETALKVFEIDKTLSYKRKGFDLYDYLKKSNSVIESLPTSDTKSFRMDKKTGIPEEFYNAVLDIDKKFIAEYINPDIMQIQDESERNREINKISSVLNVLRENIGELSQEDIQNISFGKINEYTHNGLDCIVIKAGEKSYQTFVNNSEDKNYQFMPYCKFKQSKEYDDILGIDTDENIKQSFEKTGQELGNDYTMSMVMGIGGEYSSYGIVESNGKFYTTSGEIKEVELKDIGQVTNNQKQQENKEQKSNNAKKEWINKFINSYEYTETQDQYNMRRYSETQEMEDVLKAIQDGTFAREDISKLDINENTSKWDIDVAISKIARLLKVADSLTIDGGRDYLEEFSNIPNINKILLQIKKTDNVKELFAQAEENIRKGKIPNYSKTQAEREKQNTILASAIEATEDVTKESQIEEQSRIVRQIEKNQIEQTKTI